MTRWIACTRPWNAAGGNAEIADLVLSTYVCPSGIRMFPGKQDNGGVLGSSVVLAEGETLPPPERWPSVLSKVRTFESRTAKTISLDAQQDGTAADVLACEPARLDVMLGYEDMVPEAAGLVRNSANPLVSLVNGSAFSVPRTLAQHRLVAQGRAVENRRCLGFPFGRRTAGSAQAGGGAAAGGVSPVGFGLATQCRGVG